MEERWDKDKVFNYSKGRKKFHPRPELVCPVNFYIAALKNYYAPEVQFFILVSILFW